MVILKVERTSMRGMENIVMINSNVEELKPLSEIIVTKSNGTRCQFRLIMNSSITMGYVLIGDTESRMNHLHIGHKYHVEGVRSSLIAPIKPIIDFSRIKIAGCSSAIEQIVQRVFRPRKLPSDICKKLGLQFIRGVVLYGPPGTGKTSLVKALCIYFDLQPRIINGPQLLNSLVGKSEQAVRLLFQRAVKDQKNNGDSSQLHVLVFEEMDALFPKRVSSEGGSETCNSVVNQLSIMMDGYDQLNNILIFGTTSRLDMIDPALLRGGRFEMQVKIDLPNVQERLEIFNYHLSESRQNGLLTSNISIANLQQLANATDKYSGADVAELVRLATAKATSRIFINTTTDLQKLNSEEANICVEWNDLVAAFHQCQQMRQLRENELKEKEAKEDKVKDNKIDDN